MESQSVHSRRSFLKGALICGTGIAAMSTLGCTTSEGNASADTPDSATEGSLSSITWDAEYDVVVCGSGTGGAPAAIDAHDAGAKVLVIEKKDWIGGSLRRCAGGMFGADTIVQHHLGITDDSPDQLFEYMLACGEGLSDEALVRVFADNAGKNIDWVIEELGGQPLEEWDFSTPDDKGEELCIKPGLNVSGTPVYFEQFDLHELRKPRCHWFKENPEDIDPGDRYYANYAGRGDGSWVGRGGTGLWKNFENALTERDIEIWTETELVNLVSDDGEVFGVIVKSGGEEKYIKAAKGVVIATGGFTRNEEMLLDYRQKVFTEFDEAGLRGGSPAPGECDGVGVKAALALGAGVKTIAAGNGGLRINTDAQVLNQFGEPIKRLFASSKAIGGVMGNLYPSCGAYVSTCICFGRIAGQSAAKLDSAS